MLPEIVGISLIRKTEPRAANIVLQIIDGTYQNHCKDSNILTNLSS